jgi:hypothetical protein
MLVMTIADEERQPMISVASRASGGDAKARHVLLHLDAFLLLQDEGRVLHPQSAKDWPEEEGLPSDTDAVPPRLIRIKLR